MLAYESTKKGFFKLKDVLVRIFQRYNRLNYHVNNWKSHRHVQHNR